MKLMEVCQCFFVFFLSNCVNSRSSPTSHQWGGPIHSSWERFGEAEDVRGGLGSLRSVSCHTVNYKDTSADARL